MINTAAERPTRLWVWLLAYALLAGSINAIAALRFLVVGYLATLIRQARQGWLTGSLAAETRHLSAPDHLDRTSEADQGAVRSEAAVRALASTIDSTVGTIGAFVVAVWHTPIAAVLLAVGIVPYW